MTDERPGEREPSLFADLELERSSRPPAPQAPPDRAAAGRPAASAAATAAFVPRVDERLLDVYRRARNPSDGLELRDLYVGRVEAELGRAALRPELAERWRAARPLRDVTAADVLSSRATGQFVKELFNWIFREDLYGRLRSDSHIILSSGSVDEAAYGLPEVLKECVRYALARDWYGYSDSRGRDPAREAIAWYESARSGGLRYEVSNVALTMGGTFAISMLADFFALRGLTGPALCAIPNYPPLVQAIARRMDISLVPLPCHNGSASLQPLIDALTPATSLVMVQTVMNPTGALVDERQLGRLIQAAAPSTMIVLDECHECLGPAFEQSPARAAPNVVRVSSISKTWSAPGLKIGWILASCEIIREWYEYASTTFGGPPSFFYTLVEVMGRMERWLLEGVETAGRAQLAEFEPSYGLTVDRLAAAYDGYRRDRLTRESELLGLREAAIAGLADPPATVIRPRYSFNLAVTLAGWEDSYRCFRDILAQAGVAVFPGILTLCFGGASVRVTTARPWHDLGRAVCAMSRVRPPADPRLPG